MAILALFSLLLLFASGLAAATHLWWGDSFAVWWRASGSAQAADLRAVLKGRWNGLMASFGGQSVAVTRLERFAERASTNEVESINPFGDSSELPRRSLRALANRAPAEKESTVIAPEVAGAATPASTPASPAHPAPTASDWSLVKIDSAMTARILGATARPGDIWLNLTRAGDWESTRERRAFLIQEVRLHPEWSDEDVYEVGLAIGVWSDNSEYSSNVSRNRQRVRRVRLAAERDATRSAA
jgi:hypothetical protein